MRRTSSWCCALVSLVVAGCSDTGSWSADAGPGGATTATFTLSATSASFAALQGGAAPASVNLALHVTGDTVTHVGAVYGDGQTQPPWLGIDIPCQGRVCSVVLSIRSTAVDPGEHTTTFSIGTADAQGNVLDSQAVTVTFTVMDRIAITGAAYSGTFVYGGTRTREAVPLAIQAPGRDWKAASDAAWLRVPADVQTGDATITVEVDVSGLMPGKYQGHVAVTSAANAQDTATLAFSVEVTAPALTVTQTALLLGGADGLDVSPQPLSFALGAGSAAHPFTVEVTTASGGSWLQASATSGEVDASGVTIQLDADRTGLASGTYTGQVKVTVTVGDVVLPKTVPVTLNLAVP